jgi:predicted ribosome quality control (RQC) complex YloA/Tae2 family protein
MKVFQYGNITIELGQNAKENALLVSDSKPDYTWLHLESFPSGHVIIQCDEPSNEVLAHAMKICLDGTKYKNMKDVKVSVTKVSNLKLTNVLGEVEFKSNRKVQSLKIK